MNKSAEHLNQLIGALKNVNKFSLFRGVRLKRYAFLVTGLLNASIDSYRKQYNYERWYNKSAFLSRMKCVMCN